MSLSIPEYVDIVVLTVRASKVPRFGTWEERQEPQEPEYQIDIRLDSRAGKVLADVESLIYSDEKRITEPYVFEEILRTYEHGNTVVEYQVLISVLSGIAANVGTELLKALAKKASRHQPIKQEEALTVASAYLVRATERPKEAFKLIHSKDEGPHFEFTYLEAASKKEYLVRVSKKLDVIEFLQRRAIDAASGKQ